MQAVITQESIGGASDWHPVAANGGPFQIFEWRGSGPDWLHVHHADDEAWHVLEGSLTFGFADGEVVAGPGTTVFMPAGVVHGYAAGAGTRYLIALTARLVELIDELHKTPAGEVSAVLERHQSSMVPANRRL